MDGLIFLASLIGIGLVMQWVIATERAKRGNEADIGFFAARAPAGPRKAAEGRTASRR